MVRVDRINLTSNGDILFIAWQDAEGMALTEQEFIQLQQSIESLLKLEE